MFQGNARRYVYFAWIHQVGSYTSFMRTRWDGESPPPAPPFGQKVCIYRAKHQLISGIGAENFWQKGSTPLLSENVHVCLCDVT